MKGSQQKNIMKPSGKSMELLDWIKTIGGAILIAFLLTQFVFSATTVKGRSMEDTLHDNDRLFVWKMGVSGDSLNRGDIIVFHAPGATKEDYIKRVIAFSHEYVQIKDGLVYINGDRLDEPYINTAYTHTLMNSEWYVGEDEIFVLGDNRIEGASRDSRIFGPIPVDSIVGRAFFKFYPWSDLGGI